MANVLTVPNSGIISFDSRAYSNLTVPPLSTSARIIYDGGGGVNITSYTTATTALDRFSVDGTQGRLFSVTDALTGTLFSVNNITGLPILEVQDSDTVIAGQFNTNAFVLSGTRLGLGTRPLGTNRLSVSGNSTFVGTISTSNHGTSEGWGSVRAWACYTMRAGGSPGVIAIRKGYNILSITILGSGSRHIINFQTALPDRNYALIGAGAESGLSMSVTLGIINASSISNTDFPCLNATPDLTTDNDTSGKTVSAVKVNAGNGSGGLNLTEAYVVVLD